jgi:hypothetical protein
MSEQYDDPELFGAEYSVTKIKLGKKAKKHIENLIIDHFEHSFPLYCNKVGIAPPNFYAVLNGTRQCTLDFLNKLLSGINYQVSMETRLILHKVDHGPDAQPVDSAELVPESPLNDEEAPDEYDFF